MVVITPLRGKPLATVFNYILFQRSILHEDDNPFSEKPLWNSIWLQFQTQIPYNGCKCACMCVGYSVWVVHACIWIHVLGMSSEFASSLWGWWEAATCIDKTWLILQQSGCISCPSPETMKCSHLLQDHYGRGGIIYYFQWLTVQTQLNSLSLCLCVIL